MTASNYLTVMFKNSFLARRLTHIIPLLIVCSYWIYEVSKFIFYPHRRPADLKDLFIHTILEAVMVAVVVSMTLRASNESFAKLLNNWHEFKVIRQGLFWAAISFVVVNFIFSPFSQIIVKILKINPASGNADIGYLFKGPNTIIYWIFLSLVGGGFVEETIRCLSLKIFDDKWGSAGAMIALMASSALFAMGHLYQGPQGALTNFFAGVLWGILYLRKKNLPINIFTHGFYDVIGATIACYMYR
jgi:membrane protease YdiL (CAAX protease family)